MADSRGALPAGRLVRWVAFSAFAAFAAVALLLNIVERRQEARSPFFNVVELTDDTDDPAVWGANFPHQYDSYLRTVDMERTRFGGSEAVPRQPTPDDPRLVTSRSNLDRIPQLVRLWAGYAFSVDYRERRGHASTATRRPTTPTGTSATVTSRRASKRSTRWSTRRPEGTWTVPLPVSTATRPRRWPCGSLVRPSSRGSRP